MNQIRSYFVGVVLLGSVLLLEGCTPTNPSGDATPPGFVQVLVRLEVPGDPNVRGEFDITSQDVIKEKLGSDLVIRVLATASDSESGIKDITVASLPDPFTGNPQNLRFVCASGHDPDSKITPVLQFAFLPFTLNAPPSPSPSLWQIDAVANPIATTGCTIDKPNGVGPADVEGFVRLIVTNGVGLITESKTFLFSYADVGIK